jgi:hypothetical protein
LKHESLAAEKLAKAFHILWAIASLFWAVNSAFCAYVVDPFATFGGPIGFTFTIAYYNLAGQTFLGLIGTIWHVYGAREHQREIARLEKQ